MTLLAHAYNNFRIRVGFFFSDPAYFNYDKNYTGPNNN